MKRENAPLEPNGDESEEGNAPKPKAGGLWVGTEACTGTGGTDTEAGIGVGTGFGAALAVTAPETAAFCG